MRARRVIYTREQILKLMPLVFSVKDYLSFSHWNLKISRRVISFKKPIRLFIPIFVSWLLLLEIKMLSSIIDINFG